MLRISLGTIVGFVLLQWSATALGSTRGEAGLVVAGIVIVALLAIERALHGTRPSLAATQLGFGQPAARGLVTVAVVGAAMLAVIPGLAAATGMTISMYPGWPGLLPGLFAQGGVGEETLFRGYLFRHLRPGRSFPRAVTVGMIPFVLAHLLLFVTMPFAIALAAMALAAVISFPLAHLFELGGNTIWAPALLHFVIQGTIKVIVVETGHSPLLALSWMAASAVVPFAVFFVRPIRLPAPT